MADSLSTVSSLDYQTMWRYMSQLLTRLAGVLDEEVADECVDIVVDLLGADRGVVLLTAGDASTRVVNARAQSKALLPVEREEISSTIVREALQSGRLATWNQLEATKTTSSVVYLGIVAAIAAPIPAGRGGSSPRGVLYVDFRDRVRILGELHSEFLQAAAVVMGAVIDQLDRAQATREHLVEAESHCVESRRTPSLDDLLGFASLRRLREEVASALTSNTPILILGESGTGKTLLAQAIAEASGRRPIVRAMLGTSDDLNTITSELFGHERGSFSGAVGKRIGLVEYAHKGTLVLDEVLNLPPQAQKLLLDFTQFGKYRPLGYDKPEPKSAQIRLLAATNGDLDLAMKTGRFREDLYHRLAAVVIDLPPLRERREDIPALAERALRSVDPGQTWSLSVPLRRMLLSAGLPWAGNIRQLERVILRARERALFRSPESLLLEPEHVEPRDLDRKSHELGGTAASQPPSAASDQPMSVRWEKLQSEHERVQAEEEQLLRDALVQANGVVAHAARELGIARTTLASRIESLGIRPSRRGDA